MSEPTIYTLHFPDGTKDQIENITIDPPLAIGMGLVWHNGDRYRIIDLWHVLERHAAITEPPNLVLAAVASDDDWPAHQAPTYYS